MPTPYLFEFPPLIVGHVVSTSVSINQHAIDYRNLTFDSIGNVTGAKTGSGITLSEVNNGEDFTLVLRPIFFPRSQNPVTNPTGSSTPAVFHSGIVTGAVPIPATNSLEEKKRNNGDFLGWGLQLNASGSFCKYDGIVIEDSLNRKCLSGSPKGLDGLEVYANNGTSRQKFSVEQGFVYSELPTSQGYPVIKRVRIRTSGFLQTQRSIHFIVDLFSSLPPKGVGSFADPGRIVTVQGNTYNRIMGKLEPRIAMFGSFNNEVFFSNGGNLLRDMKSYVEIVNTKLQNKLINEVQSEPTGWEKPVGTLSEVSFYLNARPDTLEPNLFSDWSPTNPLIFNMAVWEVDAADGTGRGTGARLVDYTTTWSIYPTIFAFKVV